MIFNFDFIKLLRQLENYLYMPGFREALLLRIPEKISYLLMRLVDPLRVLALSKHDCKLLHQPPPCNIKRDLGYIWYTKRGKIFNYPIIISLKYVTF